VNEEAASSWIADFFTPPPPPPLPEKLTPTELRNAIASVLARISANELADECVRFGLPREAENEDSPWRGKWRYAERRIRHWKLPELLALGRDVAGVYDDDRVLNHLLGLDGPRGVRGEMRNLIFAADGPKPRIILRDAISNDLEVIENEQYCLIYNQPLSITGLTWRQLTNWWTDGKNLAGEEERAAAHELYARLVKSMAHNGAERFVFERYCARYGTQGFDIPALIPQVYLHYDPYSRRAGGTLTRQRMDFLLLLDQHRRVVLEIDGIQHYSNDDGSANSARYAEMVAADRELRLAGYEIYRFGGAEISDRRQATDMLDRFFDALLVPPD
jgi:hypothetical protein